MRRKQIPWLTTIFIMAALCVASLWAMFSAGLTDMGSDVVINVSIGAMAMLGVIMLCIAYSMDRSPQDDSAWLFYFLLVITYVGLLTDNFSPFLDGRTELIWVNHLLCFVSYLMGAIITPVGMMYQRVVFSITKRTRLLRWVWLFMIVDIIFLIAATETGFLYIIDGDGQFQIGSGHYLTAIYPTIVVAICIVDNVRQKIALRKRMVLLAFNLTPLLGIIGTYFVRYSVAYVTAMFALMLIYDAVQVERSIELAEQKAELAEQRSRIAQQNRIMAEQSRDLTEMQTQIMLSQIQPHFIYNTLGSISSLCMDDPKLAADVTDQFARYLRGNMADIKNDRLVPFEKELEHTKTFLWIEQLRFADYLHIDYQISCTDFFLPPLTLQPLVENAVQHGITPKEEGGTVTIDVHETPENYVMVVSDDGVGFEPSVPREDGKLHLGIGNVRKRLEMLCRGTLIINSQVGAGTVVTVTIPKGDVS